MKDLIIFRNKGPDEKTKTLYFIINLISSTLITLAPIFQFFGFSHSIKLVFTLNSYFFFLFLLGTNFLMLFKKEGDYPLEILLTIVIGLGVFVSMMVGQLFLMTRIPFYSEFATIFLGNFNLFACLKNYFSNNSIKISIGETTKKLVVIFIIYLVIRLFLLNPEELDGYYDDHLYLDMSLKFTLNNPNIAGHYNNLWVSDGEIAYPWGFTIYMGLFLKSSLAMGGGYTIFILKTLLIIANTAIIFPIYKFLEKLLRNRRLSLLILLIILFNQWSLIESGYILSDMFYTLFLLSTLYFLYSSLTEQENRQEHLLISIIFSCVAAYIRLQGTLLVVIELIILILIMATKKIQRLQITEKKAFRWISKVKTPDIKNLPKYIFIQIAIWSFLVLFFQVSYQLRNGFSIVNLYLRGYPYAYFGSGNLGQFTPTDQFTLFWLGERLSHNLAFYMLNFTQLIGFIYDYIGLPALKLVVNHTISLILFLVLAISLIYFWLKHVRKKTFFAIFHFLFFSLSFASLILWGEVYFVLYRLTYPLLIFILPSVHFLIKDLLTFIEKRRKTTIDKEKVSFGFYMIILVISIIGTVGILLSLMFHLYPLRPFIFDQFFL